MKLVLLFLLDGQRFPVDLPKLVLCLESLRLKSGLILYFVLGVGLGEKGPRVGMGHVFMDRKRDQAGQGRLHSYHPIGDLCRFLALIQTALCRSETSDFSSKSHFDDILH